MFGCFQEMSDQGKKRGGKRKGNDDADDTEESLGVRKKVQKRKLKY